MAKVTNPLMSVSASGQFAQSMTFDKRGYVRQYVIPANPQSAAQVAVRNILADIQAELVELGQVLRPELKAGLGYRWNTLIIKELMDSDHAKWDSLLSDFSGFVSTDQDAWLAADPGLGLNVNDGSAFYAVAKATYDVAIRLGATIDLTAPVTDSGSTNGTEWIANS